MLADTVAEKLNQLLLSAKANPEQFRQEINSEFANQNNVSANESKKEISSAQKRVKEIDRIVKELYEDKVNGNITLEVFQNLSATYYTEKNELSETILNCNRKIFKLSKSKEAVKLFFEIVDKFSSQGEIKELTKEIIDEFIDHIVISQEKEADGKRQPQIYFKGIGLLS